MIILGLLSFLKHNMTDKISDYKILNQCLTIYSTLFDIVSRLELCDIKLTDAELLEKTFSTFHASNIVLQ